MKATKIISACAVLVALASCSSDHELSQQSPTPSDPDVINIVAASSKPVTKAAVTGNDLQNIQFATGENINVYLSEVIPVSGSASGVRYDSPLKYQVTSDNTNGGKTLALPGGKTPIFPPNGNGVKAYALYPAIANDVDIKNDISSFTVQLDQSNAIGYRKSDLMSGTNDYDTENGGIAITGFLGTKKPNVVKLYFKHHLSKIVVKLSLGDGMPSGSLNDAQINILNVNTTIGITHGNRYITTGEASDVLGTNKKIGLGIYDATNGNAGIIVPQYVAKNTKFLEVILPNAGNAKYVYKLEDKDEESDGASTDKMHFLPGYVYNYNLKLSAGNIVVVSTSIEDWNSKDISGDAELEPEPEP